MFTSVMIIVLLLSAVVDVSLYPQGRIRKKKATQKISVIAVANSVWARLSNFNETTIGMEFFLFMTESLFACPLKLCSNKNYNEPYGSLI